MPRFALITDELVTNVVLVEAADDVETDDATGEVIATTEVTALEHAERLFGDQADTILELDDDSAAGPGWTLDTDLVELVPPPTPPELDPVEEVIDTAARLRGRAGMVLAGADRFDPEELQLIAARAVLAFPDLDPEAVEAELEEVRVAEEAAQAARDAAAATPGRAR